MNHGTGRLIHRRMTEESEARSSGNSRWMMVIITMAQVQGERNDSKRSGSKMSMTGSWDRGESEVRNVQDRKRGKGGEPSN